jgi:hypothetical protein
MSSGLSEYELRPELEDELVPAEGEAPQRWRHSSSEPAEPACT